MAEKRKIRYYKNEQTKHMVSYLAGKIIVKQEGLVILGVNGVGYEVLISQKTFGTLPEQGEDLTLFCCMEANERGVKLYGFLTFAELEVFKVIRGIQGVGPKASLEISGLGSLDKIKERLEEGEEILGIGPKKAQKIILELSGNIQSQKGKKKDDFASDEAFLGLIGLGFSKEQAKKALLALPVNLASQDKIKQALKFLGKT